MVQIVFLFVNRKTLIFPFENSHSHFMYILSNYLYMQPYGKPFIENFFSQ